MRYLRPRCVFGDDLQEFFREALEGIIARVGECCSSLLIRLSLRLLTGELCLLSSVRLMCFLKNQEALGRLFFHSQVETPAKLCC
ncbi:hypothetical protein AR539_10795 [Arthrobacter sp. EPSL27]|nr:hypothetical protein AR539_10795 [Arthrobacter sp. EPSL27]